MTPRFFPLALTLLILTALSAQSHAENFRNPKSDKDIFDGSISALDLFMQSARTNDIYNAARWMFEYDLYPPRAISKSKILYKRNRDTFDSYLSVREDVYGYEITKNPMQTKINIEGAIQTENGFTSEYSATLIYKHQRWRIKSIEIE